MSLKDLQEAGVLLPPEEWGAHDLHTSVNKPQLVAALLLGLASVVMMYVGGGRTLTFIGGVVFIAFMAWITHISLKAVDVQAAQFAEEHARFLEEHPDAEDRLPGQFPPAERIPTVPSDDTAK